MKMEKLGLVALIATSLVGCEQQSEQERMESYVRDGVEAQATEGPYELFPRIVQQYAPPCRSERSQFIVGSWMAPYTANQDPHEMEASLLCIREYEGDVTHIDGESFIPHLCRWEY